MCVCVCVCVRACVSQFANAVSSGRPCSLVVVSWECTEKHPLPWHAVDMWLSKPTLKARFLAGREPCMAPLCCKLHAEACLCACLDFAQRQACGWGSNLLPQCVTATFLCICLFVCICLCLCVFVSLCVCVCLQPYLSLRSVQCETPRLVLGAGSALTHSQ